MTEGYRKIKVHRDLDEVYADYDGARLVRLAFALVDFWMTRSGSRGGVAYKWDNVRAPSAEMNGPA